MKEFDDIITHKTGPMGNPYVTVHPDGRLSIFKETARRLHIENGSRVAFAVKGDDWYLITHRDGMPVRLVPGGTFKANSLATYQRMAQHYGDEKGIPFQFKIAEPYSSGFRLECLNYSEPQK